MPLPAAGVTGAALLHPPKSSSALALGGIVLADVNPPPPLGTMLSLANEPVEAQPNGEDVDWNDAGCLLIGGLLAGAVDAEPHASLEPQASVLLQALSAEFDCKLCVLDCAGCAGVKLKTDVD